MICRATLQHLPWMVEIYNCAIETGGQTGDTTPFDVTERLPWFHSHDASGYGIFVKCIADDVVGYVALSPYRGGRAVFKHTAEISYYLHPRFQNQGFGPLLLSHALTQCPGMKISCLLAILLSCNDRSIRLLNKFQFALWGILPKVGNIQGQWVDHLYYGKRITPTTPEQNTCNGK